MILLRPVHTQYKVTQGFGENPRLYPKTNGHNGIDYGLPEGCAVMAAHAGQVTRADLDAETAITPSAGYGMHVRIQGGECLSIYGHLSKCEVRTGDFVERGQIIGRSGNTGRSTGPHLHFEVRTGVALLNCIDPTGFIRDTVEDMRGWVTMELLPEGIYLRVRTAPISGGVIKQLRPGERIEVIGIQDGAWIQTTEGWVMYRPGWLKRV